MTLFTPNMPDTSSAAGDVIICSEQLTKAYTMGGTTVPALWGVDFEIRRGELVAIRGPSGSG